MLYLEVHYSVFLNTMNSIDSSILRTIIIENFKEHKSVTKFSRILDQDTERWNNLTKFFFSSQ